VLKNSTLFPDDKVHLVHEQEHGGFRGVLLERIETGNLIINLWDCGGQDSFMDSYLSTQRSTIFQHVWVLIYVFKVGTRNVANLHPQDKTRQPPRPPTRTRENPYP